MKNVEKMVFEPKLEKLEKKETIQILLFQMNRTSLLSPPCADSCGFVHFEISYKDTTTLSFAQLWKIGCIHGYA